MLNETEVQLASLAVREMCSAVSNSLLHPFGSPPIRRAIEKSHQCLKELLLLRPRVTLDFEGERIRVQKSSLQEGVVDSTHVLHEILQSHEIHQVTFTQGLTLDEMTVFFSLLKPRFLPDERTALQSLQESPLRNLLVNVSSDAASTAAASTGLSSIPLRADYGFDLPPEEREGSREPEPSPEPEKPAEPEAAAPAKAPAEPAGITFEASGPLTVSPETEDEMRFLEAEEALDRFLEIMSEVDTDRRRDELIGKLAGTMGPAPEPSAPAKPTARHRELLETFLELRWELPPDSQGKMDQLLQRLSDEWGLSASVPPSAPPAESSVSAPSVPESPPVSPAPVPAVVPVPASIPETLHAQLLNPAHEKEAGDALQGLLENRQMDLFIPAWVVVWNGVFSGAESIQALCLRHLGLLDWKRLPRPLQLEAFQYLGNYLKGHWSEAARLTGLDRLDAWLKGEMDQPDWKGLLPSLESLRALAADQATPPALRTRAQGILKTLFPLPVLEGLYRRLLTDGIGAPDAEVLRIFTCAGPLALEFFQDRMLGVEPAEVEGPEGRRLGALAEGLEKMGYHSLESFLDRARTEKGVQVLFALAKHWPIPAYLADPVRDRLALYNPELRRQSLDLVESGGRKDLHGWAIEMLNDPDLQLVQRALKLLSTLKIAGASRYVVSMLETREFPNKDVKESFWVDAIQCLGDMGDSMALKPLMEWAQPYSLLERRKEKPLAVRRAALQALGQFRSNQVKAFLERLIEDGDPALADILSESHEKVCALLEHPSGSISELA